MRGISPAVTLAIAALVLFAAPSADARLDKKITLPDGVTQRLTYKIQLDPVTSGQNKLSNGSKVAIDNSVDPTKVTTTADDQKTADAQK